MIFIDTENPETVSRENKNKFSLSRLQILVGLVLKKKIKYTKTQEGCTGLVPFWLLFRCRLSVAVLPFAARLHKFNRGRVNAESFARWLRSVTKNMTLTIETWAHRITTNQHALLTHMSATLRASHFRSRQTYIAKHWFFRFNRQDFHRHSMDFLWQDGKWGKKEKLLYLDVLLKVTNFLQLLMFTGNQFNV